MIALRYDVLRKPLGLDFTPAELEKDKTDKLIGCFDHNNLLISCVIITSINNKVSKLRQMAVNSSYQSKGIGSRMVEFAESICIKNGVELIELNARKSAIEFYKKLKYNIIGDVFTEVGIEHYKMQKQLFRN